jgi:hypothetical protein
MRKYSFASAKLKGSAAGAISVVTFMCFLSEKFAASALA